MKKQMNVYISIPHQEDIGRALKKFKRNCEAFGVLKEYKKRKSYTKPSQARKEKTDSARKRRNKEEKRGTRTSKI